MEPVTQCMRPHQLLVLKGPESSRSPIAFGYPLPNKFLSAAPPDLLGI